MKHAALALPALLLFATHPRAEVFKEDFSEGLDPKRWMISAWVAPHNGPKNKAEFRRDHVTVVNGLLQLKLTQTKTEGGVASVGGEITSQRKFGYGTYEFEMKGSSTEEDPKGTNGKSVSGSITGAFLYLPDSRTEIDIEYEGVPSRAHITQTSTWIDDKKPYEQFKVPIGNIHSYWPHQRFHKYKWVWLPDKVQFFRDGELISTHTKVVPKEPAPFMFNHWGTNSRDWGGLATTDVVRYVYIKSFSFTSLDKR